MTEREWRAVFTYPPYFDGRGNLCTMTDYGPPRKSRAETEKDRPWNPEESHGWRSGVQSREVTEWVTEGEESM